MSFKEFKDLISAGESLRSKVNGMHTSDAKAFSPEFENFMKSQKTEIVTSLEPIYSAGKKQTQILDSEISFWNGYLSHDLLNIQVHHALLIKEQQSYEQKVEATRRAKSLAQKNDELLAKARSKGNAIDIHKYESQVDSLHKAVDDATRAQEDALTAYNNYYEEYKSKFLEILSSDLFTLVDSRQKQVQNLSLYADEIINSINLLVPPTDDTVPHLQKRLQDLEAVVIE